MRHRIAFWRIALRRWIGSLRRGDVKLSPKAQVSGGNAALFHPTV